MKSSNTIFFILFMVIANFQNAKSNKMSLDEVREIILPLKKHCIERVGTNSKMVGNVNKGNFVSDRKLQCYFKCMLLNTKVMKNDKIVEAALSKIAEHMLVEDSRNIVMNAIEKCHPVTTKSLDGCELAYEYVKCSYDFNPTLLIFS